MNFSQLTTSNDIFIGIYEAVKDKLPKQVVMAAIQETDEDHDNLWDLYRKHEFHPLIIREREFTDFLEIVEKNAIVIFVYHPNCSPEFREVVKTAVATSHRSTCDLVLITNPVHVQRI